MITPPTESRNPGGQDRLGVPMPSPPTFGLAQTGLAADRQKLSSDGPGRQETLSVVEKDHRVGRQDQGNGGEPRTVVM